MQMACVRWFSLQFPDLAMLLHHSPNGGRRNLREAARFKAMGTRAGFPDLILLLPTKLHHALFIEMKTATGRQQPTQKVFQKKVEAHGYKYIIVRSIEQFIEEVKKYVFS